MYWGMRRAESAGFKPEADGEVWVRGGRVSDEFLGCLQQEEGMLLRTGNPAGSERGRDPVFMFPWVQSPGTQGTQNLGAQVAVSKLPQSR